MAVLLLLLVGCATAQGQVPTCSLTLIGQGKTSEFSEASILCSGGTITAAAQPWLRRLIKNAAGVVWGAHGCGDPDAARTCLLTLCGNSRAHFKDVRVVNTPWSNRTLCFVGNSTAVFKAARFANNHGRLVAMNTSRVTFANSTFSGNTGFALSAAGTSTMFVQGCTFEHNQLALGLGGGTVRVINNATASISFTTFRNNTACDECAGGALAVGEQAAGKMLTCGAVEHMRYCALISGMLSTVRDCNS